MDHTGMTDDLFAQCRIGRPAHKNVRTRHALPAPKGTMRLSSSLPTIAVAPHVEMPNMAIHTQTTKKHKGHARKRSGMYADVTQSSPQPIPLPSTIRYDHAVHEYASSSATSTTSSQWSDTTSDNEINPPQHESHDHSNTIEYTMRAYLTPVFQSDEDDDVLQTSIEFERF